MFRCMRTTLTIDDDVAVRLQRLRNERGDSLKAVVNEALRRGLEQMTARQPVQGAGGVDWRLPDPVEPGLTGDPFAEEDWREEANLGAGAARLIAARLREDAARYEAGE